MKSDYIFSFYTLLLIFSHPLCTVAIKCPYGRIDEIAAGTEKGERECPTSSSSCAAYICNGTMYDNNGTEAGSIFAQDIGCIDDFLRDCHIFDAEVSFIKASLSINEMNYYNDRVTYVSGCGKEDSNTKECILAKFNNFQTKIAKNSSSYKNGDIIVDVIAFSTNNYVSNGTFL